MYLRDHSQLSQSSNRFENNWTNFDEFLDDEFNSLLDKDIDYAQSPNVFPVFLAGYQSVDGRQGARQPVFRRAAARVGDRSRAINALFPQPQAGRGMQSRGLWVQGGLSDVRRYVHQLFPRRQINISSPEKHGEGRTHVHVTIPRQGRSEHIFYGTPPRPDQNFFD
jgi:hypothetical protein